MLLPIREEATLPRKKKIVIYLFHFLYKIIKIKNENQKIKTHGIRTMISGKKKSGIQKVIQNIFIRNQIISINNSIMH